MSRHHKEQAHEAGEGRNTACSQELTHRAVGGHDATVTLLRTGSWFSRGVLRESDLVSHNSAAYASDLLVMVLSLLTIPGFVNAPLTPPTAQALASAKCAVMSEAPDSIACLR